jgi:tight adherence protein B
MNVFYAVVVGSIVFAAGRMLVGRRDVALIERRVQAHVRRAPRQLDATPANAGRVRRTLDDVERVLSRQARWERVVLRLERAGVTQRPIDVVAIVATLTALLALVAGALGSAVLAFLFLVGLPVLAWGMLGALGQRRVRAFDEQLPDLLAALSSSLRAGHGFLQSLQAVAFDAPAPTGPELRRALSETRLGRPVDDALAGVAMRVPSKDFSYVLTAIAVQRQVGGSLAGLFETVNDTVRERQKFTRKVRALTATGRTSAYALVALPFGVALLLSAMNHTYLSPLFGTHAGRLLLLFGFASLTLGTVLVRRIVSFKG